MQYSVGEDANLKVFLCGIAQVLIFSQDLLEKFADPSEMFIWGLVASVNLVLHLGLSG